MKELQLPKQFVVLNEEEQVITYGGETISYNPALATKAGALAFAGVYKSQKGWSNISLYDLAAEIFFHAALYYRGVGAVAKLLSLAGGTVGSKANQIANSLNNGIDVENHKDTATVAGVQRWVVYDAFYAVAPSII